jgi:superfamily II DNA helicase RecQ
MGAILHALDKHHCLKAVAPLFRRVVSQLCAVLAPHGPCTLPVCAGHCPNCVYGRVLLQATATARVEQSIITCLQLQSPLIIKGGFNRPNIQYQVPRLPRDGEHLQRCHCTVPCCRLGHQCPAIRCSLASSVCLQGTPLQHVG